MKNIMLSYRYLVCIFVITTTCIIPSIALAFDHPGGMHTRAHLEATHQKLIADEEPWISAWDKLLAYAEKRLSENPNAVVDFNVPAYYKDKQGHADGKRPLMRDTETAYSCALVYALQNSLSNSERNRYANKVVEVLNEWASVNKKFSNQDGALVMSYTASGMVHAAELIWNYPGWDAQDKLQFQAWAKNVLYKAADIKTRGLEKNPSRHSNWNNWGILLALSVDHLTNNQANLNADIALLKELIDISIEKDGRLLRELNRDEHSISYTAFALEPMTAAIEIVRNSGGPDLYAWNPPSKGTVQDALTFLFDRGIENPNLWPIKSAIGNVSNERRSHEIFAAMGRVYGKNKWTDWANPPVPDLGTGIGFAVPTLFHIRSSGKGQIVSKVSAPKSMRLSIK